MLDALLAELRAIRQAIEAGQDQWISWAEALRRIGGNQEDAETALRAAVAAGKVETYTVLKSGRERVWSPDLAHVGAVQRQQTEKPRRKSRKSGYRIDRR
jgi:uncharacterized protein (DUF2461 family)